MKRGHLAVLLLACIVITLMQGATISQAEDADRFAVSSIGVPEGYFIHAPRPSYQCGRIAAMCSQEQVLDDTTALVQYEVNEDELTQCFVFPIPVSQGFKAPVIVLDNGHFLMREYDPDVERTLDPRVGAVYSLVDIAAGTQEVVTPTNLVETTPWPHMGGVPTVWSEDYGMTMFIRELGSNQVVVWQGKEILSEVQRTLPVIARGGAFIDGRYTRVELTEDGVMLAYNWETGRLEESSQFAALGAEVAKVIGTPQNRPVRLAVAHGIAVFKWDNYSVYAVIAADSSRRDIEIIHDDDEPKTIADLVADETTPFSRWKELTDEEKEEAVRELLLPDWREEGKELPPDMAGSFSSAVPIDDTQVGIVDSMYQRIIVIGLADQE